MWQPRCPKWRRGKSHFLDHVYTKCAIDVSNLHGDCCFQGRADHSPTTTVTQYSLMEVNKPQGRLCSGLSCIEKQNKNKTNKKKGGGELTRRLACCSGGKADHYIAMTITLCATKESEQINKQANDEARTRLAFCKNCIDNLQNTGNSIKNKVLVSFLL